MSNENEEIVVEEGETKAEAKEVTLEEGVEELKARLDAANKRAADAETARQQAEREAHGAKTAVQETNLQLVVNAIDTLRQSQSIAKANYAAAMQAGDFDAAGEYQKEMADHSAKLLQLENGKQALEAQPVPVAPVARPTDPVEALASQLSAPSADWVRRHPEFARDPRLTRKMIGAHEMALADGHVADSDAYFKAVENLLGVGAPAKATPTRETQPPAAPVSRETRGGNVVRLTAEEREMASMMKMTPEEYAKNKLALQKEGRLH